jgi:hypothetical protein
MAGPCETKTLKGRVYNLIPCRTQGKSYRSTRTGWTQAADVITGVIQTKPFGQVWRWGCTGIQAGQCATTCAAKMTVMCVLRVGVRKGKAQNAPAIRRPCEQARAHQRIEHTIQGNPVAGLGQTVSPMGIELGMAQGRRRLAEQCQHRQAGLGHFKPHLP